MMTKRPNHAVGECYKPHSKLNIHDPENRYRWVDEGGRKNRLRESVAVVGAALVCVLIAGALL